MGGTMKIQTNRTVLSFGPEFWAISKETPPAPVQDVTVKELKEAVQDYILLMLDESATLRHLEDPMGKLEGTDEFSVEVAKQIKRIAKLFGY